MTQADKIFILDVKRTLYLIQVLNYHVEWFKSGISGNPALKIALNNVTNSHKRLLGLMSDLCDRQSWDLAQEELKEDYVKDLGLLLDELANVPDLTGIIEGVQKSKEQWKQVA